MRIPYKKLHKGAKEPTRMSSGASGFDLCARLDAVVYVYPKEVAIIPTGIAMSIPKGYEGQVRARSGWASKGIIVANSPGTIDSDYRGEVGVLLMNLTDDILHVYPDERIAQFVVQEVPHVTWEEEEGELDGTSRGTGGFGSTGTSPQKEGSGLQD